MNTNGWIKIHRRLKEWVYYNNSTMVHLFLHLLLSANHTDVTKDGLTLKRGQVLMSIPKMSQETGITVKVIRGLLSKLETTGEIKKETVPIIWGTTFGTTSGTTKAPTSTLVTICKYEDYQYEAEKEGTTSGVTSGTTSVTYKEEYIKNNNKEENKKKHISKDIRKKVVKVKSEKELIFDEGMIKAYPSVMKMKEPLTYEQYIKLQENGYSKEAIRETLEAMENYSKLDRYKSSYLTLNKWLKRN